MRISIYRWLFLVVAISMATASAQTAKRSDHLEAAITYDADRTNLTTGNSFWMQGGRAEVAAVLPHGFGIVAQVTGLHAGSISSTQVPLSLVTVSFGPRYTWRAPWHPGKHDLAVFGTVLLGEAHGFDSLFPSSTAVSTSATSLALEAGGGADLGLSRHISLRLGQVDWLRTQLPNNGTNVQNHLHINSGIVFHF